jgi:hypothetical protein
LSDRMETALVLSMIPGDLQDMMYHQAANLKDYSDAKFWTRAACIPTNQPSPMDIGKVDNYKEPRRPIRMPASKLRASPGRGCPNGVFIESWLFASHRRLIIHAISGLVF